MRANYLIAWIITTVTSSLLSSCSSPEGGGLFDIFWNPPIQIENLYDQGAEANRMPDLSTECESAVMTSGDTTYRAIYRNGKVELLEIEFHTSKDPALVMDSLVHLKQLQFDKSDSNDSFTQHSYSDQYSYSTFYLMSDWMKIRRVLN
jgi:hypothetical protein